MVDKLSAMDEFTRLLNETVNARRSNRESMKAIAAELGITRAYLYRLMDPTDTVVPSFEMAERIAITMGFQVTLGAKPDTLYFTYEA